MNASSTPVAARRLPTAPRAATIRLVQSDVSDGELISRVGLGDRNAFEILYRRYARPVFGLALRRLGDRGRAEDAVQETFASVWRAAGSYKPERGPGAPWLYAVARNAIVDNGRVRREPPVDGVEEEAGDETLEPLRRIEAICARYGVPAGAVALQFSLRDPRITSTICGVSKPERVAETVAWAAVPVPDALWEEVTALPFSGEDPEASRVYSPG